MDVFRRILDKLLITGTILSGVSMIVVVIIQVIARFSLPTAPPWTEEAARISFIFMVSFAAGLAVRDNAYINVDTFINLLPQKIRQIVNLVIHLFIVFLMAIIFIQSIHLVKIGSMQQSPSLHIPMSYIFFSICILSFFLGLYLFMEAYTNFKEIKNSGNEK